VEQSGSSLGSIRRISRSNLTSVNEDVVPPNIVTRDLILHWAAQKETSVRQPVKFGEAVSGVTPSQALKAVKLSEKV